MIRRLFGATRLRSALAVTILLGPLWQAGSTLLLAGPLDRVSLRPLHSLKDADGRQAEAAKWYEKGSDYYFGRTVKQDHAEALKWFRKAADGGHAGAMYHLGFMYVNGRGVDRDDQEAVRWFRMAADRGHANAMNTLGFLYESAGVGVTGGSEP
jgi:TPR repeat protein